VEIQGKEIAVAGEESQTEEAAPLASMRRGKRNKRRGGIRAIY